MRISLVLLFVAVLQLYAEDGYAQKTKVSISMSNVSIEQILNRIEETSDYVFLYNDKTINTHRLVSVNSPQGNIIQILNRVFDGTSITYTIVDKQIILSNTQLNVTAQDPNFSLTGVVKDVMGEPLIGVNVLVKGTTTGVTTDLDGRFTLSVKKGDVMEFSYVGYVSQAVTVSDGRSLSIMMKEDAEVLGEVVVTALGIKRSAKSLTYNVQELKAADLGVKDANFINGLAGKIAGVTINQSSTGIGGSTRVIMRGVKSLFGDNNALYVVDGIPITNIRNGQPDGFYESPDGGDSDGISNINPDDIETMSVLTGAAAAALYGAQGANGVILISTKKGEEGKTKVSYSNDTQFMSPFVMPQFQNRYGSKVNDFYSWGDKLEQPSSYEPKDFFQTGFNETNSVSVSSGTDRNQTYFSAASTNARGIIPNNTYNRYNFSVRNTTELIKDKLTLDLDASYIIQNNNNMLAQGQYHNPLVAVYLFPRGDDMNKYKTYEHFNSERNFKTQFWPYDTDHLSMENPYWVINRENLGNEKQRYMFNGSLRYEILDWMNVTGRLRVDNSQDIYTREIAASSSTLFASETGNYMNQSTQYKNTYGDIILNMDKRFGSFGIVANVGGSFTDGVVNVVGYEGNLLSVPNLFTFDNIDKNHPETRAIQNGYHDNNQAAFATVQFSYKSMLFLDVTGRNDWYSSLSGTSTAKSGFFYPSVGLSAVITEMADLAKYQISFLKLRASYSEVGNAPQRFITTPTYGIENGVVETLPSVPANFLKPERTKAYEVGANIRLFQDKINLDVTYYNSNTYNQLFSFTMPPSSGFKNYHLNGGQVNNWGIEASLGYKENLGPVQWNSNLTFTLNRNEIKELIPEGAKAPNGELIELDELKPFGNVGTYTMVLKKGGTMGDIYVSTLAQDEHGNIKVNPKDGSISTDPNNWVKAGSAAPRFNYGWSNTFTYKGFSLSVLVDARIGGVGVSATQALMDRFGVSKTTADARDQGGAEIHGGRVNAEKYYSVTGGGDTGVLSQYVYSATNVRLREASLSYSFPKKWFNEAIENISLSLSGKNLFMFYNKAPFDPELSSSTSTYYQGIDYFMQPSLRSVGFSVKVQF